MSVPALPEVDSLVEHLAPEIASTDHSSDAVWHIWGSATGGKSTALKNIAEQLGEHHDLCPILVAPPARVLDAGPLAVTEASVGLKASSMLNGELDLIQTPDAPWSEKVGAVLGWIRKHEDHVVLLCDEPGEWSSKQSDDAHFRDHAEEVALSMIAMLSCRRVVAGTLPPGVRVTAQRSRRLTVESQASRWLRDADSWGSLAAEAEELAETIGGELDSRSPLEVRLLVALASLWKVDDLCRWWTSNPGRRDISRTLAGILQKNDEPDGRFLRKAWTRLALARRPVTDALLDRDVDEAPTERARAIMRSCLLYPDNGAFTLHWSLRLDAQEHREWWGADNAAVHAAAVHADHARYYKERFEKRQQAGDPNALLDEMEAFHHASLSGDSELLDELHPYFADQLDALGRTLSRDFKRYREAAKVFQRACTWEPEDDYAHHYLAFNLDILAEGALDVENHYRRAIELRDSHLWWHSRWVNYLITRGRMSAARRAWTDALDVLGLPDPDAEQWMYENLHLWVARLLVHRGRLDFAKDVLEGIPKEALRNHPGLTAILRRLEALVEARRAYTVFPLSVPHDRCWRGPHLCPQRRDSGELARWMPGRIDAVDNGTVQLHVAQPPAEHESEPVYGSVKLEASDFDRWTRDERVSGLAAGRFVELAWYGADEEPIIRVHKEAEWHDPDLPPLFPDPARYLRASGWVEASE
jgi:tetratricopeptide (TPR) repeat protein